MSRSRPSRGERTRATILDAALGLFEESGYEATTMRAIAERAGVSVGNAYYYFDSKEHLIQGFYDRAAEQHLELSDERLRGITDLGGRIRAHLDSWFEVMAGYQAFAAGFFRTAADPASPLSPFSAASGPARGRSIDRWREVIEGSDADLPDEVRAELPEILWLFHMGLVMVWVHDRSHQQAATRLAVARVVPIVVRAIGLVDVPELRGLVDDLVDLVRSTRSLLA